MKTYFNFLNYLDRKNKNMLIVFIFLMIFTVFLDVLSISMILPLLNLFNENASTQNLFNYIFDYINSNEFLKKANLELVAILVLLSIFFIKNLFLIILFWFQSKFIFQLRRFFSLNTLASYLNKPYLFFIKRDSSELLRILIDEIHIYTGGIREILITITETLILIGLLAFLVFFNTKLSLILILSFLVFGFIYFKFTSSKLFLWGKKRIFYENNKAKIAKASFDGIKEIKLSNSANYFISKFSEYNTKSALMRRWQSFVDNLPRITLEIYFIISILLVCAIFYKNQIQFGQTLIALGIFIAVGLRLIPSINKIFICLQNLKYKKSTFKLINKELIKNESLKKEKYNKKILFKDKIELKKISYKYPGKKNYIFKKINLMIRKNSVIGLVGKSGSGKSTLLSLITGLIEPSSGGIFLDNKNIRKNLISWQNSIGFVPQKPFVIDETFIENIAFGIDRREIDKSKLFKCLSLVNLSNFKNKIKFGESGKKISGGQIQRIAIARALYSSPKILIIDEGFNALDDKNSSRILNKLKTLDNVFCIIIVSHNLRHLKNCNYIFEVKNKKIKKINNYGNRNNNSN